MPGCLSTVWNYTALLLFEYKTPKIVTIRSWKIGLFNRLVQFAVIIYIILYAIVSKKGYQEFNDVQSGVTTKVKGIASTLNRTDLDHVYRRIWDVAEYVIPPQENNAFFVMTNAIITPNQIQGVCPEDTKVQKLNCTPHQHNTCKEGEQSANGIMTGLCVNSSYPKERKYTCEIEGWCPPEHDTLQGLGDSDEPLLMQAINFTVLVKNYIRFPKFNFSKRNIIKSINNESYLKSCHYNENSDKYCPIFQLGYIIRSIGANFTSIAKYGGVVGINIRWDCNLDFDEDGCTPKYKFTRLDSEEVQVAKGWNFRFSKEFMGPNATRRRDLYKAYGILFVVSVGGRAGKFNLVPLMLNIGSGLALLAIATILCDLMLLYLVKNRNYYSEKKYLKVVDDDFASVCPRRDIAPLSSEERPEDTRNTMTNPAYSD